MIEGQPTQAHREFITGLDTAVMQRVLNARPFRLLSESDGKSVVVARDINGSNFVRRSYTQAAVTRIEQIAGIPYDEAWAAFHLIFDTIGIDIVPSIVLHPDAKESTSPIVVASEYVEGTDLISAATEVKISLAASMGAILRGSRNFPNLEAIRSDMFRVGRDKNGKDRAVLVDVDPFSANRQAIISNVKAKDMWFANYIEKVSDLLWDRWSRPDERSTVLAAFANSIGASPNDFIKDSRAEDAFMIAFAMSQGSDLRI